MWEDLNPPNVMQWSTGRAFPKRQKPAISRHSSYVNLAFAAVYGPAPPPTPSDIELMQRSFEQQPASLRAPNSIEFQTERQKALDTPIGSRINVAGRVYRVIETRYEHRIATIKAIELAVDPPGD